MALDKWTWSKAGKITDDLGDLHSEEAAGIEEIQEDTISISSDAEQARQLAKVDLNFFAMLAMPTVFQVEFPPVLITAWNLLCQVEADIETKFPQIALGIPRGHAKTTLVKLYVLYLILFTQKKFILITASTAANAINIVSDIIDMLEEQNIQALFGNWRLGIEVDKQELKKFTFKGRPIIIAAMGTGGSVRGLNLKNARPDCMVFDDIQTKEDAESKQISEGIERWLYGTAMKAKSPHGCIFIFAGNMYPTPYSILRRLKENGTWVKFISGAILADGSALWPALRPLKDLIEELDNDIAGGHPEIFFSEVLNDVDAGTNTKTDLSLIRPWRWKPDLDLPQGKFIIIDPASNKIGGDAVAVGYCEVYDGYAGLREVWEKNISPGETIKETLKMAMRTGTRLIAVESTSYQYTLLYWFEEICRQLNLTGFDFVEIYTGNYSKNARITDMLKTLTAGELFVHPETRSQVVAQIVHWNPLRRNNSDGILDLLSYMPRVLELYGPQLMTDWSPEIVEARGARVLSHDSTNPF